LAVRVKSEKEKDKRPKSKISLEGDFEKSGTREE